MPYDSGLGQVFAGAHRVPTRDAGAADLISHTHAEGALQQHHQDRGFPHQGPGGLCGHRITDTVFLLL